MSESHVVGAAAPPLIEDTIGVALQRAAGLWPDAEALVSAHQGVRLTWSELLAQADAFAAGLLAMGVAPGDRVGVWAPNCAEWTIAQFATARIGAILVNINPAYRTSELAYTLTKVGVKVLICAARFKTSDYVAMVEELIPEVASGAGELASAQFPVLRAVVQIGGEPRRGWLRYEDVPPLATPGHLAQVATIGAGLDRHDAINIQFTSGTTGLPKGATLSHRNILNNAFFVGAGMALGQNDRLCIPVPLYHCFGMVMGNLACVMHGAAMVYPSEGFDPEAVLRTVEAERCTGLHGVPTMFIAELGHPAFARFDLTSLRTGLMAGSPCPIEVMTRMVEEMGMTEVGIAYGMTETSPVSFQTAIDDPLERRVGTIGRVQPHLEVKIVDAEGRTVPRGEPGEVCTRGYSVMIGYWDDAAKTAEVLDADGWMHTGDLGVIDEAGYATIVGRIKDMIIRGGENISPREIEDFLYGHPKVAEVQVIGVPDELLGEAVCAWVRLREGHAADQGEIRAFCEGKIAHYKIPKYVRFVDSFPMTVTGKVQKFEMRRMTVEAMRDERG